MSHRPLIGITTYPRDTTDRRYKLPLAYVDAVRRAGGVPVMLPPDEEAIDELVDRLDGFILSGGGDVDPVHYGGESHPTIARVDAARDRFELALTHRLVASGTPSLSICRGCQVVNVALGGTLHEHLPDVVGTSLTHREASPEAQERHPVEVEPTSRLAAVMGDTRPVPVSSHHQAPDRVAPALRTVARAADGTIEAMELPDHPWFLAVQWHPELSAAEDPSQQRLFDSLVAAARERRDARSAEGSRSGPESRETTPVAVGALSGGRS